MGLPREEVGALIRAARGYSGFTWKQLGLRTNISDDTLQNWASGRTGTPSGAQADAIADACGVPRKLFVLGLEPLRQPVDDIAAIFYELGRAARGEHPPTPEILLAALAQLQVWLADIAAEERPGRPQ